MNLVAAKDPGTRRIYTIGQLGMSQTMNVVAISEDSLLYQLREVTQRDEHSVKVHEEFYWTYERDGEITEMNRTLWKLLREEAWSNVQERTKLGNLTQLLFYFVPTKAETGQINREGNSSQKVRPLDYEKHIAKIVLLSATGEVLKDHKIKLGGGSLDQIVKEEVIMNQNGDIAQVQIINKIDEPIPVRVKVHRNFRHIYIYSDEEYQVVYAGDFICYRNIDSNDLFYFKLD